MQLIIASRQQKLMTRGSKCNNVGGPKKNKDWKKQGWKLECRDVPVDVFTGPPWMSSATVAQKRA